METGGLSVALSVTVPTNVALRPIGLGLYRNPSYKSTVPTQMTTEQVIAGMNVAQREQLTMVLQSIVTSWPVSEPTITTHALTDKLLANWPAPPFPTPAQVQPDGGLGHLVDALLGG